MIDAVLSYHLNPMTCGVAKFNHILAAKLGVPVLQMAHKDAERPLLSVKFSETPDEAFNGWSTDDLFDVFLHDWNEQRDVCLALVGAASRVFVANDNIATSVRQYRNPIVGFCPSTLTGNPTRGPYRVLVFGMAHKLLLPHFERLKEQLDREHPDYTIELSTAVHEGNPWDDAVGESSNAMRALFGPRLRVLGFLADDALALELQRVDAVAAFYQPALRANNTTYWAAVEAGKTIYTNRDEYSPTEGDPAPSWDQLIELIAHA